MLSRCRPETTLRHHLFSNPPYASILILECFPFNLARKSIYEHCFHFSLPEVARIGTCE